MKFQVHGLLFVLCLVFSASLHAKNIVLYIDGTGDSPETNAEDGTKSPTNIQRMFELTESSQEPNPDTQVAIYIQGLATGENLVDSAGSNEKEFYFGRGAKVKRSQAYSKILEVYEPGDTLFLFGFSRGAAIVRDLANFIADSPHSRLQNMPIEMVGLFDTVASFGIPIDLFGIPTQRINLGKKLTLPEKVKSAYHLVAIHETRKGFEPTLINPRYEELWFAGSHKDIGGGYEQRGMADLTMRYMLEKAASHGVKFVSNELLARHLAVDPVTPGPDLFMFEDEKNNSPGYKTRELSVGSYGDKSDLPVKLHRSVAYWERMHGLPVQLSGVSHDYIE